MKPWKNDLDRMGAILLLGILFSVMLSFIYVYIAGRELKVLRERVEKLEYPVSVTLLLPDEQTDAPGREN